MKKIDSKNLSLRSPLTFILAALGCAKAYNAQEWVFGAIITISAMATIAWVYDIATREPVDIFKDNK